MYVKHCWYDSLCILACFLCMLFVLLFVQFRHSVVIIYQSSTVLKTVSLEFFRLHLICFRLYWSHFFISSYLPWNPLPPPPHPLPKWMSINSCHYLKKLFEFDCQTVCFLFVNMFACICLSSVWSLSFHSSFFFSFPPSSSSFFSLFYFHILNFCLQFSQPNDKVKGEKRFVISTGTKYTLG